MPRYLVRYASAEDHDGDSLYAVLSEPSPAALWWAVDDEDNPNIMEFMELPRRDRRWRYADETDAPWLPLSEHRPFRD